MAEKACQDCLPSQSTSTSVAEVEIKKQAQPASKAHMAHVPVPSTLSGPSTKAGKDEMKAETSTEEIRPPSTPYPNLIIEFCDRCRWYAISSI